MKREFVSVIGMRLSEEASGYYPESIEALSWATSDVALSYWLESPPRPISAPFRNEKAPRIWRAPYFEQRRVLR